MVNWSRANVMVRIGGEVINVGAGKRTKIDDLALMNKNTVKEILKIDVEIGMGRDQRIIR